MLNVGVGQNHFNSLEDNWTWSFKTDGCLIHCLLNIGHPEGNAKILKEDSNLNSQMCAFEKLNLIH